MSTRYICLAIDTGHQPDILLPEKAVSAWPAYKKNGWLRVVRETHTTAYKTFSDKSTDMNKYERLKQELESAGTGKNEGIW